MARARVLLPEPDWPRTPRISPRSQRQDDVLQGGVAGAAADPKCLRTPSRVRTSRVRRAAAGGGIRRQAATARAARGCSPVCGAARTAGRGPALHDAARRPSPAHGRRTAATEAMLWVMYRTPSPRSRRSRSRSCEDLAFEHLVQGRRRLVRQQQSRAGRPGRRRSWPAVPCRRTAGADRPGRPRRGPRSPPRASISTAWHPRAFAPRRPAWIRSGSSRCWPMVRFGLNIRLGCWNSMPTWPPRTRIQLLLRLHGQVDGAQPDGAGR